MSDKPKKRAYTFHIPQDRIHELRSKAGSIGGKKLAPASIARGGRAMFAVSMPRSAYDIFSLCAAFDGKTRVQFLYDIAIDLKSNPKYAHLFNEAQSQDAESSPPTTVSQ